MKDIPLKIQTASLKGRCDVVEEIQNVLSLPGNYDLFLALCIMRIIYDLIAVLYISYLFNNNDYYLNLCHDFVG